MSTNYSKSKSMIYSVNACRIKLLGCLIFCAILKTTKGYGTQEQLWFEITNPEKLSFLFKMLPARDFGGVITSPLKQVPMVVFNPSDACSTNLQNYNIKGKVILAKRGSCSFVTKCVNIDKFRPLAIIIYNNNEDDIDEWIEMSSDGTDREEIINAPVFYMLGKDGHKIKSELEKTYKKYAIINLPINITITHSVRSQPPWDYW